MIESLEIQRKHDRLTAFLEAFALSATHCDSAEAANLLIVDTDRSGRPTHLLYRARSTAGLPDGTALCAAAKVNFGGSFNPLVGALPEELCFSLTDEPQLFGLSELIVAEVKVPRCGGGTIQARLCEIVVLLAIRKAIAIGTVNAGLLAGLAHPKLHASLVAIHDDPMRNWHIAELAAIARMSRGRFIAAFKETIGKPPGAYLKWLAPGDRPRRTALGKERQSGCRYGWLRQRRSIFSRVFEKIR